MNNYYNPYYMYNGCPMYSPYPYWYNASAYYQNSSKPHCPSPNIVLKDYGREPFVVNIADATKQNNNFRLALWTGCHLQLTLMSLRPGEDIGLEMHPNVDQFIRIEQGQGIVQMGDKKDCLNFERNIYDDYAIFIPAGKWHNIINTGCTPMKLYSIYAPPEHPFGTVQETKKPTCKNTPDC